MTSAYKKEVNSMTQKKIKKALKKQFQLLFERSEDNVTDANLASMSIAMCEIAKLLQEPGSPFEF